MALLALVFMTAAALFFLLCYAYFRVSCIRGKSAEKADGKVDKNSPLSHYEERVKECKARAESLDFQEVSVTSHDGLTLKGSLYESGSDRVAILLHSHHSSAINDFSLLIPFLKESGYSVLAVDMRAHRKSDGRYITYGIEEQNDCANWVDFCISKFGAEVKIAFIGCGIGANAALFATGRDIKENVRAVIATECFTSGYDVIALRTKASLPFVGSAVMATLNCFCRVFGGFDLKDENTQIALKTSQTPTLFIHGTRDRITPCEMTLRSFAASAAPKELLTVSGARHGTCAFADETLYLAKIKDFLNKYI